MAPSCPAFARSFDADPGAAVAVLHGEGGVFWSGADLTAMGTERGNRVAPDGDGPMGINLLRLSKPVIAAVAGYAVAGVWSWRCGAICGSRTRPPCSGSSAGGGASR